MPILCVYVKFREKPILLCGICKKIEKMQSEKSNFMKQHCEHVQCGGLCADFISEFINIEKLVKMYFK
jgi:hypothetical protein